MTRIFNGRYTADIEGDFVVLLIGMRITKIWKIHKWLPLARAMPRMLKTLAADPAGGLLGATLAFIGGPAVVQYWKSFEDLDRFARDPSAPHLDAWRQFNRAIGSSGDVGVWHETYRVTAAAYECIYVNMPRFGLATAGRHAPVHTKGHSAARRIGASANDHVAVEYPGTSVASTTPR